MAESALDFPLTSAGFRAAFARPRVVAVAPEEALSESLKPAAVLVPVVTRDEGLTLLLTRRTDHLHDHPGQVSFPGGRVDEGDLSPVATALRETEEEIGLARERVDILGALPRYRTGTGFEVTPVVGLVEPPLDLSLDPFEVAEAFEVPLAFLLDDRNHQRHAMEVLGRMREYWAMPYAGYYIWGATAGMIVALCRHLRGA
jgi:8-oxo-dGTP pyrophosphatase MutT (NUDIX family)